MGEITDLIKVDDKLKIELRKLWNAPDDERFVPSDLFFANTIPLRHFAIEIADARYEFHMFDEPEIYAPDILDGQINEFLTVSCAVVDKANRSIEFFSTVGSSIGYDSAILVRGETYVNGKKIQTNYEIDARSNRLLLKAVSVWYGIQVALLHPQVKNIFSSPRVLKEKVSKEERKYNGHKIYRYVKYHEINKDELETVLHGKGEFHRKALIWYVTGHWRQYKNGNSTFIQGYWKGALRATKKAEVRDREIAI